jgi:hypothetical protein
MPRNNKNILILIGYNCFKYGDSFTQSGNNKIIAAATVAAIALFI